MGIPNEKRRILQLEALEYLEAWGLFFAEKVTYEELWGAHPNGLSRLEVIEVTLAHEEWEGFRKAAETWEKSDAQRQGIPFDIEGYIRDRRETILAQG